MIWLLRSPKPPEPDHIDVRFGEQIYKVRLRRLASARRLTLRVSMAGRDVVLSMPARGNLAAAKAFASKHAGWIALRLSRFSNSVAFADGAEVPLRGIAHRIVHRGEKRGTVRLEQGTPPVLAISGDAAHLPRRLTDWLIKQALGDLRAAVAGHAATLAVKHGPISVRDTTSRWGSCSSSGALSFSWRLILAPPFVLDYLAAHEVSHLVEMNHSVRFWRLCRQLCPRSDEARAWLKTNGANLHRYG